MLDERAFEGSVDGAPVQLLSLRTRGGMTASVCNYGARVLSWCVPMPESTGSTSSTESSDSTDLDIVLGLPSLSALQQDRHWIGAFVGRVANRIGNAQLRRGPRAWALEANDGRHTLHGGTIGTAHRVWEIRSVATDRIVLACTLPVGDAGFPGDLSIELNYELSDDRGLVVEWRATAGDEATPCSCTSHVYFNLDGGGVVDDHRLQLHAAQTLALTAERVPTGAVVDVGSTAADWRMLRRIAAPDHDGYWITGAPAGVLHRQATVYGSRTPLELEVWSTEPGLQFYAGGALGANAQADQQARDIRPRTALCLEPSGYPDATNHPHFPDSWLAPCATRQGRIEYRLRQVESRQWLAESPSSPPT